MQAHTALGGQLLGKINRPGKHRDDKKEMPRRRPPNRSNPSKTVKVLDRTRCRRDLFLPPSPGQKLAQRNKHEKRKAKGKRAAENMEECAQHDRTVMVNGEANEEYSQ